MSPLTWDAGWRERTWQALDAPWDLVVVGGGITGAGVLRAAAQRGLRALLLERRDFAWGASSRSTKLVHGGLRYLAQGHWGLTRAAVHERERLLREAADLVVPVPFLLPLERGQLSRRVGYRAAVGAYEALAGRPPRRAATLEDLRRLAPSLDRQSLRGALRYREGTTDDAALVLAVLRGAAAAGACLLNDAEVTALHRTGGRVTGVQVLDRLSGRTADLRCAVVVNATGTWVDRLRGDVGATPRVRPVRGSHLLFARDRFPLVSGVVVRSPRDRRPVSVFPWEGATLVGTTDLDSADDLDAEPGITSDEVAYLLECVHGPFRALDLTAADVLSTWSGLRPLVRSGVAASHDELRGHAVWDEDGLISAAGGKLTTFQLLVRDVLAAAGPRLPHRRPVEAAAQADEAVEDRAVEHRDRSCDAEEDTPVLTAPTTWAELRRAARCDAVQSLDDLLLRRTRVGLLLPDGGAAVLDDVRSVCEDELGWDAGRWQRERAAYEARVAVAYGVPSGTSTVSAPGTTSTVRGSGPTGSPSA